MARKLGEIQLNCLQSMLSHQRREGGEPIWYHGCGWIWDTSSRTERVFESLAKRGLVDREETPLTNRFTRILYRINDEGRKLAKESP